MGKKNKQSLKSGLHLKPTHKSSSDEAGQAPIKKLPIKASGSLKTFVRGAYDEQKLRIQTGNRIVGNFKAKLGQEPGEDEKELDAEGKAILGNLRSHFKKITDGVTTFPRQSKFTGDEVISDYTELCLLAQYVDLESSEKQHFARLGNILKDYPIYTGFLQNIKGIGPAMAGVIISEIDIAACEYPSSLWKYCGLDVAEDGAGRSRRKEHLVESDYIDKEGNPAKKMGISFNPFLKTKLIGVLGSSFLRAGDNSYSRVYRDYKQRLENHPEHSEKSKGHRHNMSIRYMVKIFLMDLHIVWRGIEGLSVSKPYHEAKLGLVHNQ